MLKENANRFLVVCGNSATKGVDTMMNLKIRCRDSLRILSDKLHEAATCNSDLKSWQVKALCHLFEALDVLTGAKAWSELRREYREMALEDAAHERALSRLARACTTEELNALYMTHAERFPLRFGLA